MSKPARSLSCTTRTKSKLCFSRRG